MSLNDQQKFLIDSAIEVLAGLFQKGDLLATSPDSVKKFCQLHLGHLEHEVFGVLFLDNQHRLIEFETMFRGTIDGASVYPREVAKQVLKCNAAAVIFCHNHPSGILSASEADKRITDKLKEALNLFDVRVLDHIIVSHLGAFSFAESGLL